MKLSLLLIAHNSALEFKSLFLSLSGLHPEILVSDQGSVDGTRDELKKYNARVFDWEGKSFGQRKQYLLDQASGDWVLVLDTDERVSPELFSEIKKIISSQKSDIHGFRIPYQNHVFGKPVYYGGEAYGKVRLFQRKFGHIRAVSVHEEIEVEGKVGNLHGKILHHSYRNPWQVIKKFTKYALLEAQSRRGEQVTLKKLFLYGPHMVWARYIQDKGYKDGWVGLFLALAFGYMESLIYWFLLFI